MVKIEWAPLNIPLRRRIQTFTVGVYFSSLISFGLFSYLACVVILLFGNIYLKGIVVAYVAWIYSDRHRVENYIRGSGLKWMRDSCFWRHFRDYFPVELVKTAELTPDRNYLLACFPHGVISVGLFTNMCCDIHKWNELFPKVRVHLATLGLHFNAPIWREIIQSWAMVSVVRKCLVSHLTISHDPQDPANTDGYTARAVGVIVGGSEEALEARPGKYILTIKKRKGFIKLAMQTGAAIVPVFSFGEVDVFDQVDNPPDSFLRKVQTFVKTYTGISPLLVVGRGFFQYTFGLLPQRRRIVQVVGAPIDVPLLDNPSEEEVDKLHAHFMDELRKLFETHKANYLKDSENTVLVLN